MTQEFVPYELAVKLKALGFDEPCFGSWWFNPSIHKLNEEELQIIKSYYFGLPEYCILAPTFSQAFRWLREKYNTLATIYSNASGYLYEWHDAIGGTHRGWSEYEGPNDSGVWDTYEEAELACLTKLIEIVESKSE